MLRIDQFWDAFLSVAERLDCGQLAAALGCPETLEKRRQAERTPNASRVWSRLCRVGSRRFFCPLNRVVDRKREHGVGQAGYMLTEVLVYIGLVVLLLGLAYAAMYRSIDNSIGLRRNADDIAGALHAGEIWRADVRLATSGIRWVKSPEDSVLHMNGGTNHVEYQFRSDAVYRRLNGSGWARVLDRVKSSSMEPEPRSGVATWRWELELSPQSRASYKPGRVRPLFTFLVVPPTPASR